MNLKDEAKITKRKLIAVLLVAILLTIFMTSAISYHVLSNHSSSGLELNVEIQPRNIKLYGGQKQLFSVIIYNGSSPYEAKWYSNGTLVGSGLTIKFGFEKPCKFMILSVVVTDSLGNIGFDSTYVYDPTATYITPGSFQHDYSYLIYTNGSSYFMQNGTTGTIDAYSTDARQIIQWAINNASNAGGGLIFIKKATYTFFSYQTVPPSAGKTVFVPRTNVTLKLEEGTVMTQARSSDTPPASNLTSWMIYRTAQENAQLKNFVVDGGVWDANHKNWTNQIGVSELGLIGAGNYYSVHGFNLDGNSTHPVTDVTLRNMEIKNVASKGINFYFCHGCRAEYVKLNSAGKNAFVIEGDNSPLTYWDSKWCTLAFSEVTNCSDGGASTAVWYARHVLFIGNKFHDTASGGSSRVFLADAGCSDVHLINNQFYGQGATQIGYNCRGRIIFDSNTFQHSFYLSGGKNNKIVNNHFFADFIIQPTSGSPDDTDTLIAGNTFNNSKVWLGEGTDYKMSGLLFDNNVWGSVDTCVRFGTTTGVTNITFTNNIFNGTTGFYSWDATPNIGDLNIYFNDFADCSTPFHAPVLAYMNGSIRWNDGYVTENSGSQTNATATTWTITHGLVSTPVFASFSFNATGWTSYKWSATSTTITVTITGTPESAIVLCYWEARTWN